MKPGQITEQSSPTKEPEKAGASAEGAGSPEVRKTKGKSRTSARSKLRILPLVEPEVSVEPQDENGLENSNKSPSEETESKAQEPKPKNNRKRVRLGEAMREVGLDEYVVAERMAGLIATLKDGEPKLLLEALKESTRILEPPKTGSSDSDAPVNVFLRHNVPRPARETPGDGNSGGAGGGENSR